MAMVDRIVDRRGGVATCVQQAAGCVGSRMDERQRFAVRIGHRTVAREGQCRRAAAEPAARKRRCTVRVRVAPLRLFVERARQPSAAAAAGRFGRVRRGHAQRCVARLLLAVPCAAVERTVVFAVAAGYGGIAECVGEAREAGVVARHHVIGFARDRIGQHRVLGDVDAGRFEDLLAH
ncbi:hypothetical protein, partial [Burkholderia cenocepacia]|uniref:hypothetical protein n=1 Tax=Burkholderia cenocepacia TaxID=95486 RepID=UPI001EFA9A23